MQERPALDRPPIAAIDCLAAEEIERAGDEAACAPGHHQHDAIAHLLADDREEGAVEVGRAPFARARVHVEGEKGIPGCFGEIGAGEAQNLDAACGLAPLALDHLAPARGERGEEIVEGRVAVVEPVKLAVVAGEEAEAGEIAPLGLGRKGNVQRGGALALDELEGAGDQRLARRQRRRAAAHQQARPGDRRERHRDLKLGIVISARALKGVGPAVVEYILAARMALQIGGHGGERRAVFVLDQEMAAEPAGAGAGGAGFLERGQKIVNYEWVILVYFAT